MARSSAWKIAKVAVFLLCLAPAIYLIWGIFNDGLGADPVDAIRDVTGDWTLRFLLITLTVSPFRQITGWTGAIRFRRMLGLYAFFYGFIHFFTYLWLDQLFDWQAILKDIAERPWITVGVAAFVFMIPLAITSTKKWIGRLGGKRWQLLHRLVYVSAACGVLHYFLLVKLDSTRPLRYAAALALLLGYRVWKRFSVPKLRPEANF
jgi:methionine sulfoxide reductase heme-binding subunit